MSEIIFGDTCHLWALWNDKRLIAIGERWPIAEHARDCEPDAKIGRLQDYIRLAIVANPEILSTYREANRELTEDDR